MTAPNASPIVNLPFLYINDARVSNNSTTPNTKLDVAAGICRDQNNIYDINIGDYLGLNASGTANSVTTINAATTGLNALDTGSLAASTVYYVYVVADPVSGKATGAMLSTAAPATGPLMPFGYSIYRHVGFAVTDASVHFLLFYQSGNNNARIFTYDAPQATAVTAGNSTTYAAVDLSALVPTPVSAVTSRNVPVNISYSFTPGAASRTLKMQPVLATGDAVTITGQVTSVVVSGISQVLAQLASAKSEINYKVSNAGDAVALNVAGFNFYI